MLTLDRAIGDKWLVSSGLAPGDRVIVEGMQKVRPGAAVKVVPFEAGQDKDGRRPRRRPAGRKSELTEARDVIEILSGPSGLRLGHRHHHDGGGRPGHLQSAHLAVSAHRSAVDRHSAAFYPGASAETVENSVTQIIEQKMTGFDNMLYLSATSDSSGAPASS